METATAARPSTPRVLQRNDVVRDTSRPEQPPAEVLEVKGPTAKLRVEGADGATRIVKAKVADLEPVRPPAETPVPAPPGQPPTTMAAPPEVRTGRTAPKDGATQPATVQQRPGSPATADTLVPPQATAAVSPAGSAHPVAGGNAAPESKLLQRGDRVLVRRGEQVTAATVVDVAGSTVKVVPEGQPPRTAGAVKVKRSDVELAPVNATRQPQGTTTSQRSGKLHLDDSQPSAGRAIPPPETKSQKVVIGNNKAHLELPDGTLVVRFINA